MADSNITVGNILIKITTQVNQASKACDTINKRLAEIEKRIKNVGKSSVDLSKIAKNVKKAKKELDSAKDSANNFSKSFNFATMLGKVYFLLNYFKRLGTSIGNMANEAINFYETSNKFQVAMGSNYKEAVGFVDDLTKAFNLSSQSVMNYQATFMNMLSALGGLDNYSYGLSERLTEMAIDYASLFNVSIENAMSQFQSALSGQVNNLA